MLRACFGSRISPGGSAPSRLLVLPLAGVGLQRSLPHGVPGVRQGKPGISQQDGSAFSSHILCPQKCFDHYDVKVVLHFSQVPVGQGKEAMGACETTFKTQPPAPRPWPCGASVTQCHPPLQPASLPGPRPPPTLLPACASALINNSARANYSLSSSLSPSLIPGKQRRLQW